MTFIHKECGGAVIAGTSATESPDGDIDVCEERICLRCGCDVQDSELEEDE